MVKNNKTAIKGLLVLGGVSTAAASVYTLSKKYAKKLLYRHHKQEDRPSILETKSIWFTGKRYAIICSIF